MKSKKQKNFLTQYLIVAGFTAAVLFGSAGKLNWWNAWDFLAILSIVALLTADVFKRYPALADERKKAAKTAQPWDKALVGWVGGLLPFLSLVLAGLDKRLGWSPAFMTFTSYLAICVMLAGGFLTYWAMRSNPFFSSYVRIQKERGHRVIQQGPYSYLRHPGYAGAILYNLAAPVLLGSYPALGVGILIGLLLVLRTGLEDKTLRKELKGYRTYSRKVRYKLIPLIW